MKYTRLILLLSLVSPVAWSQQSRLLSGQVYDTTLQAVPYVYIFTDPNNTKGTITNATGAFSFYINPAEVDSLYFSCIGYELKTVAVPKYTDTLQMILQESKTQLPTVVVNSITAKDFFRKCVLKQQHMANQYHHWQKGFTWRSVMENNSFTDLQETTVVMEGPIPVTIQYDSVFQNIQGASVHIPLYDSIQKLMHFDFVHAGSGIANLKNIDDWHFEYGYSHESEAGKYIMIEATFITGKDRNLENRFVAFIDEHDLFIRQIEFEYTWNRVNQYYLNDSLKYNLQKVSGMTVYRKDRAGGYSLKHLFVDLQFIIQKKWGNHLVAKQHIKNEVSFPDGAGSPNEILRWKDYSEAREDILSTRQRPKP